MKRLPLLAHGIGIHPNWEQVIQPLRVALSEQGWNTLSIQMPVLANEAKAVAAYTQAVRINDNDAEALSALGHLYDQRDENLEIATLFCERSIRIDPENGCYHHRLGRLYQKAQRLDDARVSFENSKAHGYDSSSDLADLKALMGVESEENKESEQMQSMKIAR